MSNIQKTRRSDPPHVNIEHQATQLGEDLVNIALDLGAQAVDATVGFGKSIKSKARDQEVEAVSVSSSHAAGVRVIVDGQLGFATSAQAPKTQKDARELVETAISLARIATSSPYNVLPQEDIADVAQLSDEIKELDLWDPAAAELKAAWTISNALQMEEVLRKTEGIETTQEVSCSSSCHTFALASSNGFVGASSGTFSSLSASAVTKDGDGKKQVDGWWSASRHQDELDSPEDVSTEAARRVKAKCGARKISSARVPVIYDPSMARSFLGAILGALSGDSIAQRASFFLNQEKTSVLPSGIRLIDDPTIPKAMGSCIFDGEGMRVAKTTLIDEQGHIQTWLNDARSAKQLGEKPGGHASRGATSLPGPSWSNAILLGGQGTLEDIVADTKEGLLVTHLLGHSPDMITGEYSRGASGFWIENGEIAYPVEEITVAGDMVKMMQCIDFVGNDHDTRSSIHAPTIRFAELQVSGT